eukprot:XP_011673914.1 PREDICTED: uncharacterized protein LOC105442933 [Strongylocentrotus purpuratus]
MKSSSYQFMCVVIHVVTSSHYICLISASCSMPDPIPNTITTLPNQTVDTGSYITWECSDGYMMDGLTNTVAWVCLEDGSWLGHTPICTAIKCPSPPVAAYSRLDPLLLEDPVVNQTISYNCINSEYTLLGRNLNRCLEDGTWENDPPVCQTIKCPSPPVAAYSRLDPLLLEDPVVNQTISYNCINSEYTLLGSNFNRCLQDGTWENDPPVCQNKLGNDYTKAQPRSQVTANQVAHQLLVNGRGNPDHYPRRARLPKVPDAPNSQDVPGFTKPFTMNDLLAVIKAMKNNKAAELDDILCKQIKQLRPGALNWLLKMFNECLGTNNIPKLWRKSKVIALLKPGKGAASPKSYRPISLLCHTYKLFERLILNRIAPFVDEHLIPEQAGFRPGKSCTGQLLNLTQFIEDGYESKLITGAAFVDLSAAYDTVNHRILTRKIFELTKDVKLTGLIQTLLSNRQFCCDPQGNSTNVNISIVSCRGLPQGSVLASLLFNVYTNDQPTHPNTRSFLYADDLCIATQNQSFVKLEESLSGALAGLIPYYATNHLRANHDKTQISAFHLKNRDANHQLRISWYGKRLKHTPNAVYLCVTLDRSLTYKNHVANTKAKFGARNRIFKKLANTNWGTDARTIRTTALALCFSAAEYASRVWSRSAHASKIVPALNSSCRAITGCLRPTKVEEFYLLCGMAPPQVRRLVLSQKERDKQENNPLHPLFEQQPVGKRLKSRRSIVVKTLLDRYSPRSLSMLGGLIGSLGLMICSAATKPIYFAVCLFFSGLGLSMAVFPAMVSVMYAFGDRYMLPFSVGALGGGVGMMMLPLLTQKLLEAYTWRGALLILGAINLHVVVSGILFEKAILQSESPPSRCDLRETPQTRDASYKKDYSTSDLQPSRFSTLCVFAALNGLAFGAKTIVKYTTAVDVVPSSFSPTVLPVAMICFGLGEITGGWLIELFHHFHHESQRRDSSRLFSHDNEATSPPLQASAPSSREPLPSFFTSLHLHWTFDVISIQS